MDPIQSLMAPAQPTQAQNIGGMLQGLGAGFAGQSDPRIAQQDAASLQQMRLLRMQEMVNQRRERQAKMRLELADTLIQSGDPSAMKVGWGARAGYAKQMGIDVPEKVVDSLSRGQLTKDVMDRGTYLAMGGATDKEISLALPNASPEHVQFFKSLAQSPVAQRHFLGHTPDEMQMAKEEHGAKLRHFHVQELQLENTLRHQLEGEANVERRATEIERHNKAMEERMALMLGQKVDKRQETFRVMDEALNMMETLSTSMNAKNYLPKGAGGYDVTALKAKGNQHLFPNDPDWVAWKQLQASLVGFDRTVLNDIGARAFQAFKNQFAFFDNPPSKKAIDQTITQMRQLLNQARSSSGDKMEKITLRVRNAQGGVDFLQKMWRRGEPLPPGDIIKVE